MDDEIDVTFTVEQLAALQDKARMSKDGWAEIVANDTEKVPEKFRQIHIARHAMWADIERRVSAAMGAHGHHHKVRRMTGLRRP